MSAGTDWESTAAERAASYPCEDFVPGANLEVFRKLLGNVSSTYTVTPAGEGSRLVLKLVAIPPRGGLLAAAYRRVMPWFDLLMMRKQFLALKRLAETTAAAA